MGIFDFLTGEFIDVIHWTDDTRDNHGLALRARGP